MLWPTVTLVGWLAIAALVIVLGRGSTIRYEVERNRVPQTAVAAGVGAVQGGARRLPEPAIRPGDAPEGPIAARPTAVATAAPPADQRTGDGAPAPQWWLVDAGDGPDWLGQAVAGPFADLVDAQWASMTDEPLASTRPAHGVLRPGGAVLPRQSPEERAWFAELGSHLEGLPEDWAGLLTEDDALTTLVVEVSAALVEAGLPLHPGPTPDLHGAGRAGGVCLTPDPGSAGVLVAWRQHDRMDVLQVRGPAAGTAVRAVMNEAVADVLSELGFRVEPIGPWGCWRVLAPARD